MKFTSLGVLALLAVSVTSGCTPQEEAPATEGVASSEAPAVEGESSQDIEVDEGLFNVEVTLPELFFQGQTEQDIAANAREAGASDYTINADGSVTYTMSKAAHDEAVQEMRDGIDSTIQETVNESPNVFKSVTYNDAVSKFEVTVDKDAYEADMGAGFIGFNLGLSGTYYQMFQGVPTDDREVVINFIDASTNEVFDTQKWPFEE
jgi:hypothetical protein